LPVFLRQRTWQGICALEQRTTTWRLARLRRRMFGQPPHKSGIERCLGYTVHITGGPNFYTQYKDEFIRGIYHFEARQRNPLIIDGGSNMGTSILYFKHLYPQARIIGFEPDPAIFRILQENTTRNGLKDVTLVNAALGAQTGTMNFVPDGSAGGHIGDGNSIEVRMERLSDYLDEPVDFLKLNIEGEELPVLQEAAARGKLHSVHEMVLEYHGWAGGEQRLGDILNLLDRQGFRYLIHDFDAETCGASKPPFRLTPQTTWFCLIYARRLDEKSGRWVCQR
jgi:FkbM family methyltransferase